jgi:uncharacterized protein (TIGR02646 family)
MKHIRKQAPPEYAAWCTPTEQGWNPSWGALEADRSMRRCLVTALVTEQGHLCAYCNTRIAPEQGRHHVEHLLPRRLVDPRGVLDPEAAASIERSGIPRDRLDIDYRNLLACCPNKDGKIGTSSCGDHKGGELLSVTPLDHECETVFRYLLTGTLESDLADGRRAIDLLGLNRRQLEQARRKALEGWLEVALEVQAMAPERRDAYLERLLDADPLPEFVIGATQLLRTVIPPSDEPR